MCNQTSKECWVDDLIKQYPPDEDLAKKAREEAILGNGSDIDTIIKDLDNEQRTSCL